MLGGWHGGCRKYLIWRYTNQMSPARARTRGKSVRKRHSSHCETLAPVAIQQQLQHLTETGLHRPRWVHVTPRSGRLRSIRNMLPDLLWSEVAACLESLLLSQSEKKEKLRPSLPSFPPPPCAFCLPGSWTSESNFRTDKILGFSSAHTGVSAPPPFAGYHVKRHMEQIKQKQRQEQQQEEEEEALSLSLPSHSTLTITSITNSSWSKQDSKHLPWNQTSPLLNVLCTDW